MVGPFAGVNCAVGGVWLVYGYAFVLGAVYVIGVFSRLEILFAYLIIIFFLASDLCAFLKLSCYVSAEVCIVYNTDGVDSEIGIEPGAGDKIAAFLGVVGVIGRIEVDFGIFFGTDEERGCRGRYGKTVLTRETGVVDIMLSRTAESLRGIGVGGIAHIKQSLCAVFLDKGKENRHGGLTVGIIGCTAVLKNYVIELFVL